MESCEQWQCEKNHVSEERAGRKGGTVEDRRGIKEELLLMDGVELNPGPGEEPYGQLERITQENAQWVFEAAVWSSKGHTYRDYVRSLLKYFCPKSLVYGQIAVVV